MWKKILETKIQLTTLHFILFSFNQLSDTKTNAVYQDCPLLFEQKVKW